MSDLASFRPSAGVLPTRDAVPVRYRWYLSSICQDWAAWQRAYEQLDAAITAFAGYQKTLAQGPAQLLAAFTAMDAMGALSSRNAMTPNGAATARRNVMTLAAAYFKTSLIDFTFMNF